MSRVFLVFLGAVALLSCESPFGASEGVPEEMREFVIEMNEHRASLGLEVLEWDPSLSAALYSF